MSHVIEETLEGRRIGVEGLIVELLKYQKWEPRVIPFQRPKT